MKIIQRGISSLATRGFLNFLSDEHYLKLMYRIKVGTKLDLNNPKTFSEKIQWLKLYDRNPLYHSLVDKYAVKKYVAEKIGQQYIIPTLGVWDNFDDINFETLPSQFVLKCTHDSGGVVICKDKANFDWETAKRKINKSLGKSYYLHGREWPYLGLKPRILGEKYMGREEQLDNLIDYKFYCFNGVPKYCQVITDRNTNEKIDFYDMNWEHLEFNGLAEPEFPYEFAKNKIECPKTFQKMKQLTEALSPKCPFSRIDLYEIQGKTFFGEITFYPASGFGVFQPGKWNYILGDLIQLSEYKNETQ